MTDHQQADGTTTLLPGFKNQISALVVGAQGGIGCALIERLCADPKISQLHAWSRGPNEYADPRVTAARVDITDEASIAAEASKVDGVDLVIVATGLLHNASGAGPEKSWKDLSVEKFAEAFMINTVGPALLAKHLLPKLPRHHRSIFAVLSARVGSIEDNRLGGWYSYRASKAALNQVIKTLSIELTRSRPQAICVGLHPGTVDTRLSSPFQNNVAPGKLFTPDVAATHLLGVIDGLKTTDTGGVFAWDGKPIPY